MCSPLLRPDKYTQLNSALFSLNGCTGYVLQPEVMRSDIFDPLQEKNRVKYIIDVRVGLQLNIHKHTHTFGLIFISAVTNATTVSEMPDCWSVCVSVLQIIAARHLPKPGRSIASPFVEVELCGHTEEKFKTAVYRKECAEVANRKLLNVCDLQSASHRW